MRSRILTLLAILGPGIIVMVGDNDAGGVSTYAQAGQDFGLTLLWTLPLLIPVLIVNQEMVVRLGAVTGVGHGRLIRERYGRIWGSIAVIDLFVLNFLTIATEFIGVSLALSYFHVSPYWAVPIAGLSLIIMTTTGSFRRWERFMFVFVFANLLLIPLLVMSHPSAHEVAFHLVVPSVRGGVTSNAVLLIIAIVGTTVAPWQLFFQQSNIIDKKITPRWINYERADTVIGSFVAVLSAIVIVAVCAAAFDGSHLQGQYHDALGVAEGLRKLVGPWAGAFFAIILLNASIIGAAAVTLSTTYAFGDVGRTHMSLDRGWREATGFYSGFAALVVLAAGIVLIPHAPLGLITTAVQAFAGILLPLSSIFLLLLCNDPEVLGPWVNKPWLNAVATAIISLLVALSFVLMATTVFPHIDVVSLSIGLGVVLLGGLGVGAIAWAVRSGQTRSLRLDEGEEGEDDRLEWRMPPAALLTRAVLTGGRRLVLVAMAAYLVVAVALLLVKAFQIG
jgi:NRAMP (natural resistance-associated macrophage protein)-like metal ion transporter